MKRYHQLADWLGKVAFHIDPKRVHPLLTFTWGCGTVEKPDLRHVRFTFGDDPATRKSLYFNGVVFARLMWASSLGNWRQIAFRTVASTFVVHTLSPWLGISPFWALFFAAPWPFVGIMIRWKGVTDEMEKAFFQGHFGNKLGNGDFAITARWQSDASAAKSDVSRERDNVGQAQGWACGTK